jgi:hypothetical protein
LKDNGFDFVCLREDYLEITAIAFMQKPETEALVSLGMVNLKIPDMEKQ